MPRARAPRRPVRMDITAAAEGGAGVENARDGLVIVGDGVRIQRVLPHASN